MDGHRVAKTFFANMNEGWIRERKKISSSQKRGVKKF
jgi:hypothetical protein